MESGDTVLPLVDVNSSNAATTWPLLLDAIKDADFISLDLVSWGLFMCKMEAISDSRS